MTPILPSFLSSASSSQSPKILFMGTPEFASVILKKIHEVGYPIVGVVAQPDKPQGRGQKMQSPPVAIFAKENTLLLLQPSRIRDEAFLAQIKSLAPDYIIVAAYGKILPDEFLVLAKKECLNVHASLLPEYRGAAPINQVLLDGRDKTGVAIMRVVKELDAGPIFLMKEILIEELDDAVTLTQKLAVLGADALIEVLQKLENNLGKPVQQDHVRATHVRKMERSLALIDWARPAKDIFNQIRALLPWPVAETKILSKNLKIYSSLVLPQKSGAMAGSIVHIGKAGFTVATGTTDLLIKEVQLEGKKRMNAFDLANGLRLEVPVLLGF